MVCAPCQKKAEARRKAMAQQIGVKNQEAAIKFEKNTERASEPTGNKVLPRYESNTVWNAWYQAFMMKRK